MDIGSFGILIPRLVVGAALMAHGAQKLFGAFGGPGFSGAGQMMESLGFRPGKLFAASAIAAEMGGGMLCVIGLGGPLGPAVVIMFMIVAAATYHLPNGFFAQNNGCELNVLYAAAAAAPLFLGNGMHSLDHALGWEAALASPKLICGALVGAIVLALVNLLVLRRPAAAPENKSGAAKEGDA